MKVEEREEKEGREREEEGWLVRKRGVKVRRRRLRWPERERWCVYVCEREYVHVSTPMQSWIDLLNIRMSDWCVPLCVL